MTFRGPVVDTTSVLHPLLEQRLIEVYGDSGREWIAGFPALLERVTQRWGLTLVDGFSYIGFTFVVRVGLPGGTRAVLKLGPMEKEVAPDGSRYASELDALRYYGGQGICRLLDGDATEVSQLLELLEPGTMLADLEDDVAATEIAAGVMNRLFRPLPAGLGFIELERWGQAFERVRAKYNGGCGAFPADLFEPAADLWANLCATQDTPVLLHGDLHHYNILRASREPWLAIDPKGLRGERAFEIGAYLYNKIEGVEDMREYTLRRIGQFADILGLDRQRLIAWGFAQAVISRLWTFEDTGKVDESDHIRVARALLPFV